ncbi:cellulose synthase operon protein YhjQ [Vibrio chagasii]|uniref:Cellulose synthase operon protein YhjQ n=1 Tax=Vibrio chagasii TaxID=170679 RepID=A0A7V7NRU2_9VIBR|nr:cellulose biosynthesis protein BcsQ [Vibrio chagasii]KAB0477582.1 cellulose synthase operon protein YhjQ [Vibrio chagasii]
MKRLLFASLRGGCGSTTITANLSQALVKINKQVLAIDSSPENLLGLHLGLPYEENDGWAVRTLNRLNLFDAGYQSPQGAMFLPFGKLSFDQHFEFEKNKEQHLNSLVETTLNARADKGEQWQLFHAALSDLNNLAVHGTIDAIDMVFIAVTADAVSYSALQSWIQSCPFFDELLERNKLRLVINHYQPETEVGRDFMLVLKKEFGSILVPVLLHRDTALLDCVANLTTVQHFSPFSQAAKDFQSLAFWCVSTFSSHYSQG